MPLVPSLLPTARLQNTTSSNTFVRDCALSSCCFDRRCPTSYLHLLPAYHRLIACIASHKTVVDLHYFPADAGTVGRAFERRLPAQAARSLHAAAPKFCDNVGRRRDSREPTAAIRATALRLQRTTFTTLRHTRHAALCGTERLTCGHYHRYVARWRSTPSCTPPPAFSCLTFSHPAANAGLHTWPTHCRAHTGGTCAYLPAHLPAPHACHVWTALTPFRKSRHTLPRCLLPFLRIPLLHCGLACRHLPSLLYAFLLRGAASCCGTALMWCTHARGRNKRHTTPCLLHGLGLPGTRAGPVARQPPHTHDIPGTRHHTTHAHTHYFTHYTTAHFVATRHAAKHVQRLTRFVTRVRASPFLHHTPPPALPFAALVDAAEGRSIPRRGRVSPIERVDGGIPLRTQAGAKVKGYSYLPSLRQNANVAGRTFCLRDTRTTLRCTAFYTAWITLAGEGRGSAPRTTTRRRCATALPFHLFERTPRATSITRRYLAAASCIYPMDCTRPAPAMFSSTTAPAPFARC